MFYVFIATCYYTCLVEYLLYMKMHSFVYWDRTRERDRGAHRQCHECMFEHPLHKVYMQKHACKFKCECLV